jgi:hypothetical protein
LKRVYEKEQCFDGRYKVQGTRHKSVLYSKRVYEKEQHFDGRYKVQGASVLKSVYVLCRREENGRTVVC